MLYLLDLEVPNICECYYRHGVITPPDYVVFTRFGGTNTFASAIIDMGSLHRQIMLYLLDLEVPNICECYYRHGVITPPDYVVFTRFGGTKHLRVLL